MQTPNPSTIASPFVDHLYRRLRWDDLNPSAFIPLLAMARDEDLYGSGLKLRPQTLGDITSRATVAQHNVHHAKAAVVAREAMVVCGLPLLTPLLRSYHSSCSAHCLISDGEAVTAGTILAWIEGPAESILQAERPLLNFLQHLSGIASQTARYVEAMGSTSTRLVDTRKTTPGYRLLEKIAVACGGGWNHRLGLYDRILIKDNHLASMDAQAGDHLSAAVRQAKHRYPNVCLECEVDTIEQIQPVIAAGADVILLDNFSDDQLKQAVQLVEGRTLLEASGGITLDRLPRIANIGLDFISTGALVHQASWKDLALDWSTA